MDRPEPMIRRRSAMLLLALALLPVTVRAEVSRIVIESRERAAEGRRFGSAGRYEILNGRAFGELDPEAASNALIQDIGLAPRNALGRVEYSATFRLARPVDPEKASGVLVYEVVNRGNGDVHPGDEGHVWLVSGWQGDLPQAPGRQTIEVPIATQPDGSPLTGRVLARFADAPPGATTLPIRLGSIPIPTRGYPPADLDEAGAVLTSHASETPSGEKRDVRRVPREDWAFADCEAAPFPGTPAHGSLCLRSGFEPDRMYELVYTARDPLVLGVGLAATRDLVSFFRHAERDSAGTPNPAAGLVRHVVSYGNSQSGNFIRTFVHLGFNADEQGRIVWDGAFPRIAARHTPINFRFAVPGGAATLYEPGSEGVLWWHPWDDAVRGRPRASLLDRCRATGTCPKIVEAFSAAEFWGLRMSPGLVGTDARADIPLPPGVRRYYHPGTTHGGGSGGFPRRTDRIPFCELPQNPNPHAETDRALTAALVEWVVDEREPPPSRYPRLSHDELVPATTEALAYPAGAGIPFRDGLVNPVLDYDLGEGFAANDMSGVVSEVPPRVVQVLPTLVPAVDGDGNETAGVPSVLQRVPLGTYLGWNIAAAGFFAGERCRFFGGYVPFARTRAERESEGDSRPSLEERYGTQEGYECLVREAVDASVRDRFLLPQDAERLLSQLAASDVLPPRDESGPQQRALGESLCAGARSR